MQFNRSVFVMGNGEISLGHAEFEHLILPFTSSVNWSKILQLWASVF